MDDTFNQLVRILLDEPNKSQRDEYCTFLLEAFNNKVKIFLVSNEEAILHSLQKEIDLGAIIISDQIDKFQEALHYLTDKHYEIPIFISSENSNILVENDVHSNLIHVFSPGNFDELGVHLGQNLSNNFYPEENLIIPALDIAVKNISSLLHDINIVPDNPTIALDKRFREGKSAMIPIHLDWGSGIICIQTTNRDLETLIREGKTNIKNVTLKHVDELLGEMLNLIWGDFKKRFNKGIDLGIELPIIIDQEHNYVSTGAKDPFLCLRFEISDANPEGEQFDPVFIILKFSFYKHLDMELLKNTKVEEDLIESGELELF